MDATPTKPVGVGVDPSKGQLLPNAVPTPDYEEGSELAIWAVAHRLLRLIWKILHEKVRYVEHGPRSGNLHAIQKRKRALVRQLRRLGYAVQITPIQGTVQVDV
jgi:hypothetical protein